MLLGTLFLLAKCDFKTPLLRWLKPNGNEFDGMVEKNTINHGRDMSRLVQINTSNKHHPTKPPLAHHLTETNISNFKKDKSRHVPTTQNNRQLPPDKHDEIWALQKPLNFPLTVYGIDRPKSGEPNNMVDICRVMSERLKSHSNNEIIEQE